MPGLCTFEIDKTKNTIGPIKLFFFFFDFLWRTLYGYKKVVRLIVCIYPHTRIIVIRSKFSMSKALIIINNDQSKIHRYDDNDVNEGGLDA